MYLAEIIFWLSTLIIGIVYTSYFLLCRYTVSHKKLDVKREQGYEPTTSIVIPTWNEENTIKGKIEDTLNLNYPRNKLEIIVIDSGSTDKTIDIVKEYRDIKLIQEKERRGKANALNTVFRHCNGEIVVISDADCRLQKDVLKVSMPYFADSRVGALTGEQIIINVDENIVPEVESAYRHYYHLANNAESILDSTFPFNGEFSAFRKKLIEKIHPDSVADDTELALRIRKKGYRVIFIPEAKYLEYAPSEIKERTKQKYRRAQGLIQVMLRFHTFTLNPRYGYFGLLIFPFKFFSHIISPILILIAIATFLFLEVKTQLILLLILVTLAVYRKSFIYSFLHSQYSCLKGFLTYILVGSSHSWEKIEGTRRYAD
ncbi:MAG: glycosyltransferase [Candidatus Altiarchaeota archaeon]|nr:glycosyltransferase [Candidatus Altiarchaeota archaeon]